MQYHGVGRHHDERPHAPTCGCEWDYDGPTITVMKFYFLMFVFSVVLSTARVFNVSYGQRVHSDLNPIENVWDAFGRQVAGRNYPPTNKNTLIRALTEEWDKLPQQLLDNVVQSMSDGTISGENTGQGKDSNSTLQFFVLFFLPRVVQRCHDEELHLSAG
ncbi:hypothetical protein TNCV_3483821 [Trichonephila clavipes]|nr:hypothetical protein TNCV_3483821 [Trichonephila clavipes]